MRIMGSVTFAALTFVTQMPAQFFEVIGYLVVILPLLALARPMRNVNPFLI